MTRTIKPKIGDVCEIAIPNGLAYVQYTHDHPSLGELVRVLPGIYSTRPDIKTLAQQTEIYFVFYPLKYALRDRQTAVVSNEPVPGWARQFPIMRKRAGDHGWLIGDGSKQSTLEEMNRLSYVEQLTPEQKKLSIGGQLCPHPALVKDLARGWMPERAEEFRSIDSAEADARKEAEAGLPEDEKAQFLDHFLYFPKKSQAERAGERLRGKGWRVEVRKGGGGEDWLTLAKQPAPIEDAIEDIRDELEDLAEELGGEYDRWGASVE